MVDVPIDPTVDPSDVKHCFSLFLTHSLIPCLSWGTLPEADKIDYNKRKCGSILTDNIMKYYFHNVTDRDSALARLEQLKMIPEIRVLPDIYASKPVIRRHEDHAHSYGKAH